MASNKKTATLINKRGIDLLNHIFDVENIEIKGKRYNPFPFLLNYDRGQECYVFLSDYQIKDDDLDISFLDLLKTCSIEFTCRSIEEFDNIIKTLQQVK